MSITDQRAKAEHFRSLHHSGHILVLPNAWDVSSARIFEDVGFSAIGTTSAGIAATLGRPDGESLSRTQMLEAVGRIAAAVALPVTADMETGYGDAVEGIAETARGLVACGAIGLNIEDSSKDGGDSLTDVSLQVEKIRAVGEVAKTAGVPLVINARTDVYLLSIGKPESRCAHAIERANTYRDAGADCLFVPGVRKPDEIARLAREINGPINVLAGIGVPNVTELEQLGVARVSVGSGPYRATMTLVRRLAEDLIRDGTYKRFTENIISHAEVNRFFDKR